MTAASDRKPDTSRMSLCPASADTAADCLSVVIIIDSLNIGGAQRLVDLQLRAMEQNGHRIRVVNLSAPSSLSRKLKDRGVEVVDVMQKRLLDIRAFLRLRRILCQWRPDIVHAHLIHATLTGALLARLTGSALVVTLHSEEANRGGLPTRIKNGLEYIVLRGVADRVIACGPRVALGQGRRLGQLPIDVVSNQIDAVQPLLPEQRKALRSQLGYGPRDLVCLAVGRLTRQKGFDVLVDAFGQLPADHPPAKLMIAGDGEECAALSERIRVTGISRSVRLLGARSDVDELMAIADVFILSSLWEGLPLALLEAMTAGLPIIATKVGDVATVTSDAAAILVPPGDVSALSAALVMVLDRANLRADLAAAARRRVRPFTDVSGFVDELIRVYFLARAIRTP
ncbi:MAG: glycosyltransferase [Candidatus Kaistia colombiensis]|nr:MAG: glycosyltransferase [Kaistia sp.]